jgi:photosynthetic reaction center cytochrome c subunit
MKTKLSVRGFSGISAILAISAVALSMNLSDLRAQAPAAGGSPQLPETAANMKDKTAGEFYKNVKVLKDVPAGEIRPAMEYITTALGVGCGSCHVPGKFASDDKHNKNVARSMMKMTIALNATVFDDKRELTCYTCHRGAARPAPTLVFPGEKAPAGRTAAEIFPPLAVRDVTTIDSSLSPRKAPATIQSGPPTRRPMAPPEALPSVDDVFGKYAQALGGDSAIDKVMSLVEKGTVEMLVPPPPQPRGAPEIPPSMGTVPAEIDRKLPGKAVWSVQFPGRPASLEGTDGTIGWTSIPHREETGGELALLQEFAEFPPGLKFRENHSKVLVDATEKIGDRDAYRVVGTRADGSALDILYFDAQTGLLLKSYTTMQSVLGGYPVETYYEDYRDVSGFKVPFTLRVLSPDGDRTYKWEQVDVNAPVEDSRFTLPPSPPREAARPGAD